MGRIVKLTVLCLLAVGCSTGSPNEELASSVGQELDVSSTSGLIKRQGNLSASDEATRQQDTQNYYNTAAVRRASDGALQSITSVLPTLSAFKTNYGFGGAAEKTATYYNRGDLGIGREMHCVDNLIANGQVACYVKNYGAGDAKSEFTFGGSKDVAFSNIAAHNAFATVAMVYRESAPAANKVVFIVYNAAESLQIFAALDRAGQLFANAFVPKGANPSGVGTPGTNFNNHIPSNCVSCHGGQNYVSGAAPSESGSLFLPFDLDQLDYTNSPFTRAEQLVSFKQLNQIVWKVAARSGSDPNHSLQNQLNSWYNNTVFAADTRTEVFENDFNGATVPPDWSSQPALYSQVVRPSCRGCHMANLARPFDSVVQFQTDQARAVADICTFAMPHSLQAVRLFWQSPAPIALEAYLRSVSQAGLADQLHACGPKNVATLDPQQVTSLSIP